VVMAREAIKLFLQVIVHGFQITGACQ